MRGRFEQRLKEQGISLPIAQPPGIAKIRPWVIAGNLLFVSGQLPQWEGEIRFVGKLGRDFDLRQGREAARLSALNVLAQAREAADGGLDGIARMVKISGFVNCTPDFTQVAEVVNGASELFLDVFGEKGGHARTAVGATNMPLGVAVEIEAIMEIADGTR